jgi:hypothetical protein
MWLFRKEHNTVGTMVLELQVQMSSLVVSLISALFGAVYYLHRIMCEEWMGHNLTAAGQRAGKLH